MSVCVYVCVSVCVCVCVSVRVCVCICICTCTCVYEYSMYSICTCMYVYVYMYMYMCMFMHMYAHIHTETLPDSRVHWRSAFLQLRGYYNFRKPEPRKHELISGCARHLSLCRTPSRPPRAQTTPKLYYTWPSLTWTVLALTRRDRTANNGPGHRRAGFREGSFNYHIPATNPKPSPRSTGTWRPPRPPEVASGR